MMKKRIVAAALTLSMAAAMAVPSFAASTNCRCGKLDCYCDYIAAVKAYQKDVAAKEEAYRRAVLEYQKQAAAKEAAYEAAVRKVAGPCPCGNKL